MKRINLLIPFVILALAVFTLAGCEGAEEAAEELLEEWTDYEWELGEGDFEDASGVDTPKNWRFLFAVDLQEQEHVDLIDEDFEVDISKLEDLGFDLGQIDWQVVFAKVGTTPNGDAGLRYANKVLVSDGVIKLDGENLEKLGASVGSSGTGWYACYVATEPVGFLTGEVTDCDGNAPSGEKVLVIATDGPFFTYAAANGSWALPSLNGKPAMVNFDAGDCAGSDTGPVTDPEEDPNDKDPGTEPPNDPFTSDDTNVIYTGMTDLTDPNQDPGPGQPGDADRFEFDDGEASWGNTGDCFAIYDDADAYDFLFPGGQDAGKYFAYIATGSPTAANLQSCTVTRTFQVPDGATEVAVAYDFISQEYEEWLGSAYNDIFTVLIQGETGYIIHRTINGEDYWDEIDAADADIGFIADSADAQYNPTSGSPFSNGPYLYDGHLKWEGTPGDSPRGMGDDPDEAYGLAVYPLPDGVPTVTILITVSDVADAIYDTAAILDYIEFR